MLTPKMLACLPCFAEKKPTVHLVHGLFIERDDLRKIYNFARLFRKAGFPSRVHPYGRVVIRNARDANRCAVKRLFSRVERTGGENPINVGDVLVAFSNGALVVRDFAVLLTKSRPDVTFSLVVLINPALPSAQVLPPNVERVHLYHTPTDGVLRFAPYLPGFGWGDQGRVGLTVPDPRYTQYDLSKEPARLRRHQDPLQSASGRIHFWPQVVVHVWEELCQ